MFRGGSELSQRFVIIFPSFRECCFSKGRVSPVNKDLDLTGCGDVIIQRTIQSEMEDNPQTQKQGCGIGDVSEIVWKI